MTIRRACAILHFDPSTYHYWFRRNDPSFFEGAYQGDLRDACPLRLSVRVLHSSPPRLGREHEEGLSPLQGVKSSAQEREVQASGEGQAAGGSIDGDPAERCVGDVLCSKPACDWSQTAHPDGSRHVFASVTCDRSAVQLPGEDVVATPEKACQKIDYPKTIRVDNGSEFISRDMDRRAYQRGVTLDFFRPGKPADNVFIEAFNSKQRVNA